MPSAVEGSPVVRVLVIGGSYGGLAAALNILDLTRGKCSRFSEIVGGNPESEPGSKVAVQINIVDERDGFYHLIGSPLGFASTPHAEKFWIKYDEIVALQDPAINVVQGSAIKVDPNTKTATILDTISGNEYDEKYDFLIAASGLRREKQTVPLEKTKEKYLVEAAKQIAAVGVEDGVEHGKGVVVIGGGAVGIEMASELAVVHPSQRVTLIHSHDRLLSSEPLPIEVADLAAISLREQGVELVLGYRVNSSVEIEDRKYLLKLSDGTERTAGFVIWAISKPIPSTNYLPQEVHSEKSGLVEIKDSLHIKTPGPFANNHFAIGDLVHWTGIKRCGAAMHMGLLAANNIHQEILVSRGVKREAKYLTYPEVPPMIALACGKDAISYSVDDGAKVGEDIMKMFFGDDLGFKICWDYLQLGTPSSAIEEADTKDKIQKIDQQINDLNIKETIVVETVRAVV